MAQYRYPGAQPFSTAQEHIFFGREQDMEALHRLIRLEPLVVLHAKSGLGKSSLLNAGIVPQFLKDGKYRPVNVRFNAYNPKSKEVQMPLETTREAIRTASESLNKPTFLEKLLPREDSLWYLLKKEQAHNGNQQQLLLLFDQFEELFTYPEEAILLFKMEMAEVLHTQIPQRFRQLVEQEVELPSHLDAGQLALLHESFGTKVVMAIRSDRISLLDRIADYLPQVKRTWFELDALGRDQAEEAILNPAYKRGEFASPVFDYADEAIEKMLDFLTKVGTQKIESFQLQILCQAIERKVISGNLKQVSANDLGNIKEVYENYYEDQLRQITNPKEQLAAREFIEEGLIFEKDEIRISLYEGQIFQKFGISEALLRKLEDTHLIRRELLKGVYIYELSHDTLVAPVLKAKKERLAVQLARQAEAERLQQERELEEVKQKAAQERQLREQAEQAKTEAETQRTLAQKNERWALARTKLAGIVSVIAIAFALIAGWSYVHATRSAELVAKKSTETERALEKMTKAEKERLDGEIKKYVTAAQRMIDSKDLNMARKILLEAQKLDSLNQDVNKLLKELE